MRKWFEFLFINQLKKKEAAFLSLGTEVWMKCSSL